MIEQLSVFLENKAGRLAEMTRVLGDAGFNMRALVVADTAEFGIARIIVDRPSAARETLEGAGFGVTVTLVIAVEVPDRPGGIADILRTLGDGGVNVEYAYAFMPPAGDAAVAILRAEDGEEAVSILGAASLSVLAPGVLYETDAS